MEAKNFSKKEAISFGWDKMKSNLGFFIILLIIVVLVSIAPDIAAELIKKDFPAVFILAFLVSSFLSIMVSMGLIKIALKLHDNEKSELADLFSCFPLFLKYLSGLIIYSLIVFFGLILFIVPGIILAIKFFSFDYFIIDKKAGPIEALKKSSEITKGVKWSLFLFFLLVGAINLFGALCFLVGLFLTVPTTIMATTFVYRKLATQERIAQTTENI